MVGVKDRRKPCDSDSTRSRMNGLGYIRYFWVVKDLVETCIRKTSSVNGNVSDFHDQAIFQDFLEFKPTFLACRVQLDSSFNIFALLVTV